MIITKKLFYLLKVIQSSNHPNRVLLSEEHKKLVALLNSGLIPYSVPKSTQTAKLNQVYNTFDLHIDPNVFKTIINKIVDCKIIEALLDMPTEISYSHEEKMVLHEKLSVLKLLASLKQDLKEIAEFGEKYENMQRGFFEQNFQELNYLKITLTRSVTIDDIEWFIYTNIFDLMMIESELFTVPPTYIYQLLIKNTEQPMSKKNFNEHCQVLLNKKTQAGQSFNYGTFYSILYNIKYSLSHHLNKPFTECSNSTSPRFHTFPKSINKLPQLAIKNHFYRTVNKR
ncbi:hypothetical protein RVIR1_03360 [Candidatus Rickettsiella viridis]|uniref:Uncharacterized protein n=1 Tax=Candidatus Rickettsiella viridis TaxID=676208 RepID=A0A2Z5UTC3_9COXI|nr:hypothetical protein [Candidatus Rickettsiella viridis]BBB14856.1 hypothetical protein RVIR1_03360 [Candidatus Rickettsiella viridis]